MVYKLNDHLLMVPISGDESKQGRHVSFWFYTKIRDFRAYFAFPTSLLLKVEGVKGDFTFMWVEGLWNPLCKLNHDSAIGSHTSPLLK